MPVRIFYGSDGVITRVVITDTDKEMSVHSAAPGETQLEYSNKEYQTKGFDGIVSTVEALTGKRAMMPPAPSPAPPIVVDTPEILSARAAKDQAARDGKTAAETERAATAAYAQALAPTPMVVKAAARAAAR